MENQPGPLIGRKMVLYVKKGLLYILAYYNTSRTGFLGSGLRSSINGSLRVLDTAARKRSCRYKHPKLCRDSIL
jgi:hypothetical protein